VFSDISHKQLLRVKKYVFIILAGVLFTGFIAINCILVILLIPDKYIDNYVNYRITKEFRSAFPGYKIKISDLHFNKLENRIELGFVEVNSGDSSFSCSIGKSSLKGINWWQLILKGDFVPDVLAGAVAEAKKDCFEISKVKL